MLFELCDKMSQLPNPHIMPCLVMIPSAPFDKRSLVPTCLISTPSWMYDFHHSCLLAPHALWHPICLMAPHLPLWCPSAFFASTSAFRHPVCLLQAPSAFWLPILKRPPDKRSRICPFFSQEAAKTDLVDSVDAQWLRQILPGENVMLLALINPAASMSIHEHPWASMSIHARASVPVTWISSSSIVWAHKEKCLAFSLALSCKSKFLLASLNGLAQSRKAKSCWGSYQISQEIL